ncbi:MAG: hypothetical protein M3011_07820 [Actinomycetota bacterium]|nr:hypothetical protein [Actinomycetota bacterium]
MEDAEVVHVFVEGSANTAFGSSLHVDNDTLKLDGWWSIAYRVSDRTVIVRDEETPTDSTAVADVTAALTARGLTAVGTDLPAITLLTYTNLDLGYAPWVLWSTDLDTGEDRPQRQGHGGHIAAGWLAGRDGDRLGRSQLGPGERGARRWQCQDPAALPLRGPGIGGSTARR